MNNEELFLFEYVKRDSNILIYGMGLYGRSYIQQIEETNWCHIIGVSDRVRKDYKYDYYSIQEISEIPNLDSIVIAIENASIASEVYYELLSKGIDKEKIYNVNARHGSFPQEKKIEMRTKPLIVFADGGGLGDVIIDCILVKKVKELVGNRAYIVFGSKYPEYIECLSLVDVAYLIGSEEEKAFYEKDITLFLSMHNVAIVLTMDEPVVQNISEQLYEYCLDCKKLFQSRFSGMANNYRFTQYALLLGRNRIEQLDMHGILGISRSDDLQFRIPNAGMEYIKNIGLRDREFITINRDIGNACCNSPKLWPIENYIELTCMIKKQYPKLKIVMVGSNSFDEMVPFVDLDLTGKTTCEELLALMKMALIHIGGEGGLVHLRHFLGGRSLVFFGPTNPQVFGYEENENLCNNHCSTFCEWVTDDWYVSCIKKDVAECMRNIKPADAFVAFEKMIGAKH